VRPSTPLCRRRTPSASLPMPTYAITGSNGFIASHVVSQLLEQGFSVRATVRHEPTEPACARLNELAAANPGKVEIVKIQELTNTEALAEAFKGCEGVFHMAAVHPKYGFEDTPVGREALVATAVEGSLSALKACVTAGIKRVVLTSSLAAIECGNDEGTLTEGTWSKPEVFDDSEKLEKTTWGTHFTYVKSKTEQEKAAIAFAAENSLDLRVVVPGNLCVGPIANKEINGTMTRIKDIMAGTNTLKGAADLGVVHVQDVSAAHVACMTNDGASGRYIVTRDMVRIEELFETLKALYPAAPIAKLDNMDYASGVPGKARAIESRTEKELGLQLKDLKTTLKDAVDSMVAHGYVAASA